MAKATDPAESKLSLIFLGDKSFAFLLRLFELRRWSA